ncbi:aldo/keto reductase [Dichomitus squalens LYAD-421 SS1]|uniref:aldo/keto reductase n=1 Tax=Dichomitus squalens (strain LYAD-421) TaxID=732165 RepID=UPI0004415997|nr:aldo/keto reductase [Dichomitus squalens LYAD-421 SS1]EJF65979.1 aldo/keto reductase [Dichomitus squalens LYAD-421 SS1]
MSVKTVKLGGTASGITVGKVAHGLMTLTQDPNVPTDEEAAFAAIKAGIDVLPPGVKMFLNSGEFCPDVPTRRNDNLTFPEYVEKTFLSVKGGMKANTLTPDSSAENLRRSVDACVAALRGTKKIDLFETARVDPNVPLEQALKTLVQLKEEGKFDHLGMSECRAETLRKANSIHPITAVEIEVSLWSYEEETRKVIATAEELGISVIAYSPLGRGLLTGTITSPTDLPEHDMRRRFDRFQEENLKHNLGILEEIKPIAAKKQIALPQLALAWVASLGPHVIPLPGSGKPKRVVENILSGDIELTQEEQDQIADILSKHEVKGDRYIGGPAGHFLHLWG